MKSITQFIRNIKNLLPYLIIITIYFFFINLEASKDKNDNSNLKNEFTLKDNRSSIDEKNLRISIPVIPFEE